MANQVFGQIGAIIIVGNSIGYMNNKYGQFRRKKLSFGIHSSCKNMNYDEQKYHTFQSMQNTYVY